MFLRFKSVKEYSNTPFCSSCVTRNRILGALSFEDISAERSLYTVPICIAHFVVILSRHRRVLLANRARFNAQIHVWRERSRSRIVYRVSSSRSTVYKSFRLSEKAAGARSREIFYPFEMSI